MRHCIAPMASTAALAVALLLGEPTRVTAQGGPPGGASGPPGGSSTPTPGSTPGGTTVGPALASPSGGGASQERPLSGTVTRSFRYDLSGTPVSEEGTRPERCCDVEDNEELTVGLIYNFNPPSDASNAVGWATYFPQATGNVTYRVRVLAQTEGGQTVTDASQDILVDTTSGFLRIQPAVAYTAGVSLIGVDSTGTISFLRTWSFAAHEADTADPQNGPGGLDCANGFQVDGTRYDGTFSCNCSGSNFNGPNCEVEDEDPQLRLPAVGQVIPADAANTTFVMGFAVNEDDAAARSEIVVSTLTTPTLELPDGGILKFYYHMFGADTGNLTMSSCTSTSCTSRFAAVGQQHTSSSADWTQVEVALASGTTSVTWVASQAGNSVASDISIDTLTIDRVSEVYFNVTSDSPDGACNVENGCITDGSGQYGDNEVCTYTVVRAVTLDVTEFETEEFFDFILIDNVEYSGSNSPSGITLEAGAVIEWSSDFSVSFSGYTICGQEPQDFVDSGPTLDGTTVIFTCDFGEGDEDDIETDLCNMTADGRWVLNGAGATNSSNTGPSGGRTGVDDPYIYIEASQTHSGGTSNLTTPQLQTVGSSGGFLVFSYHMYGSDTGSLLVQARDASTGTFTTLLSRDGQQHSRSTAPWTTVVQQLPVGTNGIRWVGTVNTTDSTFTGDIAVDSISIGLGSVPQTGSPTIAPSAAPGAATSAAGRIWECDFNPSSRASENGTFCDMVATGRWAVDNGGFTDADNTGPSVGQSGLGADRYAYAATLPLTEWLVRTKWSLGSTYNIAPLNVTTGHTDAVPDNNLTVRYALIWQNETAPRGAFIDGQTGEIFLQAPNTAGLYYAAVEAQASDTSPKTVFNILFNFTSKDTDNPANGPNGADCVGGILQQVDEDEFDSRFTCDCPTDSIDANCNSAQLAARSQNQAAATVTYSVSAAVVFLLLAVVLFQAMRGRHARNKPVDMSDLQSEILATLGMGGAALNVGKDEIGLTLIFDDSAKAVFQCGTLEDSAVFDEVEKQLLLSLRGLLGLPQKLAAMLKDSSTTITLDTDDPVALLRMKRLGSTWKPGLEDRFAAALQTRADKRRISINDKCVVTEVLVAVPKRVPRELDRRSILRLDILGEGNFGEVFKATFTDARGGVSITAAVKTLKSSDLSGRSELLREAAFMALLSHKNIIALIGVVTVPRNMPALLVLEFCEQGTLLEHVQEEFHNENVDIALLLTYCHDVACGMSYLSSRRIVHRDVAARNVLIDVKNHCKVSDFGMSAALGGGDDDYASNYVKMVGELPIRWSAIEVLTSDKYSKASDVWAFGVLVYEVMSGGRRPYEEFATLLEVAERVKAGYTMECPVGCREEVHVLAMQPCWNPDPTRRPGFSDLAKVLVDLGAAPPDDDDGYAESLVSNARETSTLKEKRATSTILERTVAQWKGDMKDRAYLGPSVHQIHNVLVPKVVSAVRPPWKSSFDGKGVNPPQNATVFNAVEAVVKPAGAHLKCPRDGLRGAAFVDTLTTQDDVGRATALLSYTWGYKVTSIANALRRWTERVERNPKRTYIWVCSLCLNQHRINLDSTKTPEELAHEFGPRVATIGRILPMLEPWRDPEYLTRAWCLFELYTAIGKRDVVDIDIILTESENKNFLSAMASEGYGCIDEALAGIRSEEATATLEADLHAIRALVQSKPGGFSQLNTVVKAHLSRWFESKGAVRVEARRIKKKGQKGIGYRRIYPVGSAGSQMSSQSLNSESGKDRFVVPSASLASAANTQTSFIAQSALYAPVVISSTSEPPQPPPDGAHINSVVTVESRRASRRDSRDGRHSTAPSKASRRRASRRVSQGGDRAAAGAADDTTNIRIHKSSV